VKRLVGWSPAAKLQLRALDRKTALEILHAIDRYMVSGEGDIKQLSAPLSGCGFASANGEYFSSH
jgi:hypothetical protein